MMTIALTLQIIFFALVMVAFLSSRSASLFHPMAFYLMFHGIVFVLRPLVVHYLGLYGIFRYLTIEPDENLMVQTLLVSSFGLLVFSIPALLLGQGRIRFPEMAFEFTNAQRQAFVAVLLLLGPLAIYSATVAGGEVSFSGGDGVQMSYDMLTGNAIYVNSTGYIVDAQSMGGALGILIIWRYRFAWWSFIPLGMFLALRAFMGWGRWAIVLTLMSLALLYLFKTGRRWPRVHYAIFVVPLFLLFQSLGADRNYIRDSIAQDDTPKFTYRAAATQTSSLDTPDFANFDFLAYVLRAVPDLSQTYTYFTQYLQLFTEPIPRILWSGKPVGPPIQLINLNDYGNFRGMTVSLIGDGWMSLGWVGIVVTLGFAASVLALVHRWFWRNNDRPKVVLIYCLFVPLSIQWFRDGGISIAKFVLFTMLPLLLWDWMTSLIEGLGRRLATSGERPRPRRS